MHFSIFILIYAQYIDAQLEVVPLETEHLYLRKVAMSDVKVIAALALDPMVNQKTGTFPIMHNEQEVQAYMLKYHIGDEKNGIEPLYPKTWVIEEKKSNRAIGIVLYEAYDTHNQRAELGYALLPEYWNHGYTTQACNAVIRYALDQGVSRIYATVDPENGASERVLHKLNMSYEGLLRSYIIVRGERKDRKMYAIIK